jgi:flagellar biosynthesis GTPase FlhF
MKIDFTKIEGYREDMSAEEKLALLDKWEPDGWVKKDVFDRTASELAEYKRKLKEKMSEEERKEAERQEAEAALKAELESLRKEAAVTKNKSKFLSLGYEEKLAEETARALADGDMDKVFANQAIHLENIKKAAIAAALANDPKPPAGGGGGAEITKEQFDAMGYSDRLKLFNEQPEIYKKFTEG